MEIRKSLNLSQVTAWSRVPVITRFTHGERSTNIDTVHTAMLCHNTFRILNQAIRRAGSKRPSSLGTELGVQRLLFSEAIRNPSS